MEVRTIPSLHSVLTNLVEEAKQRFGVEIPNEEINSTISEAMRRIFKPHLFPLYLAVANSSHPLYNLNADTFGHICKYLSVRETYNFGLVSKWTRQMMEPVFMQNKVLVIDQNVKPKDLFWMSVAYSHITKLKLCKNKIGNDIIASAFNTKLHHLKYLNLDHCSLADIYLLGECCTNIDRLKISTYYPNVDISPFLQKLKQLKSFSGNVNFLVNMADCFYEDIVNLELSGDCKRINNPQLLRKFTNLIILKLRLRELDLSCISPSIFSELHLELISLKYGNVEDMIFNTLKELYLSIRNFSAELFMYLSNLESLSLMFDNFNGHLTEDIVMTISEIRTLRRLTVTERYFGKYDPQSSAENCALITMIESLSSVGEIFYRIQHHVSFTSDFTSDDDHDFWVQTNAQNIGIPNELFDILPPLIPEEMEDDEWEQFMNENEHYQFAVQQFENLAFTNFCNSLVKRTGAVVKMRSNQKVTFYLSCEHQKSREMLPNFYIINI